MVLDAGQRAELNEMFEYHASDGGRLGPQLDVRAFAQLLTEGFSYSFLDGEISKAVKGDLRVAIAASEMNALSRAAVQSMYDTFDTEGAKTLSPGELAGCVEAVVYGSTEDRLRFLFLLTDMDGDGYVSLDEIEDFLQDFRSRFYRLGAAVAQIRLRHLKRNPHAKAAIVSFYNAAVTEGKRQDVILSAEASEGLDAVDSGAIDIDRFLMNRRLLPRLYNRLLHLMTGIVERGHGQIMLGDHYAPTATVEENGASEAYRPVHDGIHEQEVKRAEFYDALTSPATLTLETLRESRNFKDCLVRVDSSAPPQNPDLNFRLSASGGPSGAYRSDYSGSPGKPEPKPKPKPPLPPVGNFVDEAEAEAEAKAAADAAGSYLGPQIY